MSCSSSWSDLPIDILRIIVQHLHYSDIIHFSAICRTWREVTRIKGIKYIDKVPWLFGYEESSPSHASFDLYDPYHKQHHTIDNPPSILVSAKILASKHGWILFFKEEDSSIFFYSPFNNKIIELPPLIIGSQDKGIFSSTSPVSSRCVVFVVSTTSNYICINTCSPRDTTWTKHCYNGAYSDLHGVTYMKGVLYCAFSFRLCAFNHKKRVHWKRIRLHKPIWIKQGHYSNDSSLIAANNGNLFLMYYNGNGGCYNPHTEYRNSCNVLRFDWHAKEWLGVEDLGNKMLFVGHNSHSSMLVSVAGEAGELANSIHFGGDTKERFDCYSYCFDKISHSHSSIFYVNWMVPYNGYSPYIIKECQRNSFPQLYGWIKEQWSAKKYICLQPPQFDNKNIQDL